MTCRRSTLCLAVLMVFALLVPASAGAEQIAPSAYLDQPPAGYPISGRQAVRIADRMKIVADYKRRYQGMVVYIHAHKNRWQVSYATGTRTRLEVVLYPDGRPDRTWTGLLAALDYARGGYVGLLRHPWIYLPFGLLFMLPFFDPRRPFRLLHLDLLVTLAFGISLAAFDHAHPAVAIWTAYGILGYLLVRMLAIGFGRARGSRGRVVPLLPTAVLAVGIVVLFGARIGLNIAENGVIDVGYMSVVGADRIEHRLPLYVDNSNHGDTYGPLNYAAYVPFELLFPTNGTWDKVTAAHVATMFFDLLTIVGLVLLGRRLRAGPEGTRLGLALGWAWAAHPFTLFALTVNTNDGLVAALIVFTLLAITSPVARGVLVGAGAAAKFMPGVLLPLIAVGVVDDRRDWRAAAKAAVACVGIVVFSLALYWPSGGLREFWNCTLGYQMSRDPDVSMWGIVDGIDWLKPVLLAGALGLAGLVAFLPRRRNLAQVAALAAAVTIAIQLPAGHWFYYYIVWFLPTVLVAFVMSVRERERATTYRPYGDLGVVALPPSMSRRSGGASRPDRSRHPARTAVPR